VRASFLAGILTSGETIDRLRITAFREAQSYKGLINLGKTGSISTLFFFGLVNCPGVRVFFARQYQHPGASERQMAAAAF
jgi:hypothetical protein